jgi:hypothetical protein
MTTLQIGQSLLILVFVIAVIFFHFQGKKNNHWAYQWMFKMGIFMILVSMWTLLSPIILREYKNLNMLNFYFLNAVYLAAGVLVFLKILRKSK